MTFQCVPRARSRLGIRAPGLVKAWGRYNVEACTHD